MIDPPLAYTKSKYKTDPQRPSLHVVESLIASITQAAEGAFYTLSS